MNSVAKQLWIDGLKTYHDLQLFGPLRGKTARNLNGYCAIGMLVFAYCTAHQKEWDDVVDGLEVDADVFAWAEFDPFRTLITVNERMERIFTLNDHFKFSFPDIAEAIRLQL